MRKDEAYQRWLWWEERVGPDSPLARAMERYGTSGADPQGAEAEVRRLARVLTAEVEQRDGGLHQVPQLAEVLAERERQDAKWGEQNHHAFAWLGVLVEEVGEFAQAALKATFSGGNPTRIREAREELIQVAAVALAMLEAFDRNAMWLAGPIKSAWQSAWGSDS